MALKFSIKRDELQRHFIELGDFYFRQAGRGHQLLRNIESNQPEKFTGKAGPAVRAAYVQIFDKLEAIGREWKVFGELLSEEDSFEMSREDLMSIHYPMDVIKANELPQEMLDAMGAAGLESLAGSGNKASSPAGGLFN